MCTPAPDRVTPWHRRAVVYQIYPLSFQDSNADGRGDVPGILSRLDHLAWLGVDAVWLCPIYRSPLEDFGYDISDYEEADPVFGSLDDVDRLLRALHDRGIRLLLDFVPNHTSDQHRWFIESRSSRRNSKHDWYIWADARPGGRPPNNWLSRFGGSAWQWDQLRQQYYLHSFLKSQPDLNLRSPRVRAALAEVMRFWLRRGVDGFRIDAAAALAKDAHLRDDPANPEADACTPPPQRLRRDYSDSQPEAIEWLAEMRDVANDFPGSVLLGEVDTRRDRIAKYYGSPEHPALHLPLNYLLLEAPWRSEPLVRAIREYLRRIPDHGWPIWAIGGQDKPRIATTAGEPRARTAALLAFTLRGTALFYAGDEIGMQQGCIPTEEARDPFERRVPGYGLNRDPERTPMQWDASGNAGFTAGQPWLPINEDYQRRNVEAQRRDASSPLHLYRRLIALRHAEPALSDGAQEGPSAEGDVVMFTRAGCGRRFLVMVNTGDGIRTARLLHAGRVVVSSLLDRHDEPVGSGVELRADEGVVIAVE